MLHAWDRDGYPLPIQSGGIWGILKRLYLIETSSLSSPDPIRGDMRDIEALVSHCVLLSALTYVISPTPLYHTPHRYCRRCNRSNRWPFRKFCTRSTWIGGVGVMFVSYAYRVVSYFLLIVALQRRHWPSSAILYDNISIAQQYLSNNDPSTNFNHTLNHLNLLIQVQAASTRAWECDTATATAVPAANTAVPTADAAVSTIYAV